MKAQLLDWLAFSGDVTNTTQAHFNREAQFFFTSRLAGEPAEGVPDIHYTAGAPRTFFGGLAVRF